MHRTKQFYEGFRDFVFDHYAAVLIFWLGVGVAALVFAFMRDIEVRHKHASQLDRIEAAVSQCVSGQ